MPLIFATSNPHKVEEARAILGALDIEVRSLSDCEANFPEPVEDGQTFEQNAELKARYYARLLGERCLAEDSGLEVDALGGAPGVYSARYADGATGSRTERDQANNHKLLREAESVEDGRRQARFVCALCVADPKGEIIARARGTQEGVLAREPRGGQGFGYDPLFYIPELGLTNGELSPQKKNARSHRGQGLRELARVLRA